MVRDAHRLHVAMIPFRELLDCLLWRHKHESDVRTDFMSPWDPCVLRTVRGFDTHTQPLYQDWGILSDLLLPPFIWSRLKLDNTTLSLWGRLCRRYICLPSLSYMFGKSDLYISLTRYRLCTKMTHKLHTAKPSAGRSGKTWLTFIQGHDRPTRPIHGRYT